jgi:hypothetical protein
MKHSRRYVREKPQPNGTYKEEEGVLVSAEELLRDFLRTSLTRDKAAYLRRLLKSSSASTPERCATFVAFFCPEIYAFIDCGLRYNSHEHAFHTWMRGWVEEEGE